MYHVTVYARTNCSKDLVTNAKDGQKKHALKPICVVPKTLFICHDSTQNGCGYWKMNAHTLLTRPVWN